MERASPTRILFPPEHGTRKDATVISDWEHAELLDRTTPELPLVPTGLIWGTQGDPLSRPSVAQLTFGQTPEGRWNFLNIFKVFSMRWVVASERVHRLCEFLVFETRLPSTPLMFLWQQIGC
jgi:hypothetical protein